MISPTNKTTVSTLISEYIAKRVDVKQSTRYQLERAGVDMAGFFGPETLLVAVTPADADDFRAHLKSRLHENTTRRICSRAKQLFKYAVRKRWLGENPFADMKGLHVRANRSRDFFVTEDLAYKVLDSLGDTEWKVIFALARWGGLRCPSEHLALTWADVRWLDKRLRVPSPKTAHHEGKDSRIIPLFPEIESWLLQLFWERGRPAEGYVITQHRGPEHEGRKHLTSWRMAMRRAIEAAGIEPWPKVFQNLRSTRETELANSFPIHVVVAWIGNSEAIAKEHYLQMLDSYFDRATSAKGGEA